MGIYCCRTGCCGLSSRRAIASRPPHAGICERGGSHPGSATWRWGVRAGAGTVEPAGGRGCASWSPAGACWRRAAIGRRLSRVEGRSAGRRSVGAWRETRVASQGGTVANPKNEDGRYMHITCVAAELSHLVDRQAIADLSRVSFLALTRSRTDPSQVFSRWRPHRDVCEARRLRDLAHRQRQDVGHLARALGPMDLGAFRGSALRGRPEFRSKMWAMIRTYMGARVGMRVR